MMGMDLVASHHVKFMHSLGYYDKNVFSAIIPIETCDVLLEIPTNFSSIFFTRVVLINVLSLPMKTTL